MNTVDDMRAVALATAEQLCHRFGTSYDSLYPERSVGKEDVVDSLAPESTSVHEVNVARLSELDATIALQHETLQRQGSLEAPTLDDAEVAAIKGLPRNALEVMMVRLLDYVRRNEPLGVETAGKPLGVMDASFNDLVAAVAQKREAQVEDRCLPPPQRVVVRRGGTTQEVAHHNVVAGDILLLRNEDVVPADAVALAVTPLPCDFFIEMRAAFGPSARFLRRAGKYVECEWFGGLSILPESASVGISESHVIVAMCMTDGGKGYLSNLIADGTGTPQMTIPSQLLHVDTMERFVSCTSTVKQRDRSALLRLAACNTVVIESEGVLEEPHPSVTALHISNRDVLVERGTSSDRVWDVPGVSWKDKSQFSGVADSLNSFHMQSFAIEGESASPVAPVSTNDIVRRLMIGAMLSFGYKEPSARPIEHQCLDDFCMKSSWSQRLSLGYEPVSSSVAFKGHGGSTLFARLFRYTPQNSVEQILTAARKILVIWGNPIDVLKMSMSEMSPKGVVPAGTATSKERLVARCQSLRSQESFVSIAIADVVDDAIGSKRDVHSIEVATLLAGTTTITYLGGLVVSHRLHASVDRGLGLLRGHGYRVVVLTSRRSQASAEQLAKEAWGDSQGVVAITDRQLWLAANLSVVYGVTGTGQLVTSAAEFVRAQSNGGASCVGFVGGTISALASLSAVHANCTFVDESVQTSQICSQLYRAAQVHVPAHQSEDPFDPFVEALIEARSVVYSEQ